MNVLVLHGVYDLRRARRSTTDYIFCFERYAPQHRYLYHLITLPVTDVIRNANWDVVIFDSTSLGISTDRPRERFLAYKRRWSFLSTSPAIKIVFPQDDADHGRMMDDWFAELKCDAMFTVRPEFKELVYPRMSRQGDVLPTMSGFVDDRSLHLVETFAKPFAERSRLIGQRVMMHPACGGRHSRLKGESAEMVKRAGLLRGLNVDISTDVADVFLGDDWYAFLGDCKFVLGAEGGMSLYDPYGELRDLINAFLKTHPNASFKEIEHACFPGLDGQHMFIGFSPRILEAAMLRCGLILVEGEYLGLIKPHVHYIPLRADGSNMDEVFEEMRDENAAQRRIEAAYRDLIENPKLRYSHLVQRVMEYIDERRSRKDAPVAQPPFAEADHDKHLEQLADLLIQAAIHARADAQQMRHTIGEQLAAGWAEPFRIYTTPPLYRSALCKAFVSERVRLVPEYSTE